VAVDPNIEALLGRLAKVKPLPAPSQPFRSAQAAAGSQVRDAAGRAFASTPALGDSIKAIQQGGSAQTGAGGTFARVVGSPVGKAVLGGLNVIDLPRRTVISGFKEAADFLDNDQKTVGSRTEFFSQIKDPTFGFGTVAPGEGWGGRAVGFFGDVLLDPVTYVTLGATVPAKALALGTRGASAAGLTLRAGAKVGKESANLRQLLGTKFVGGREGRMNLANIVKQYGGDIDEVKRVASDGKSAVPEDIAKVLGLQRNGLYMFGSRVRIPLSGPIGSALEYGIIKTRLGITNTNMGKKLQYLYTPRGATARLGDQAAMRADMASGRVTPERVALAMSSLNGAENARKFGAKVSSDTARLANAAAITQEVRQYDDVISGLIESGADDILSPAQRIGVDTVKKFFSDTADVIDRLMQVVDPTWSLPRIPNYVPHMLTDKSRRWMEANLDNKFVQRLEHYLTADVMDLKNNMAGRYIRKGTDFLESGKILQTGSIEEINRFFREVVQQDFDLFETGITRIMGKYIDTTRGAAEVAALLDELKSDDFVRLLRSQGEIDPEFADALKIMVKDKFDEAGRMQNKLGRMAQDISREVNKQFGADSRSGVTSRLRASAAGLKAKEASFAGRETAGENAALVLDDLLRQVNEAVIMQRAHTESLGAMFEERSVVMDLMKLSYDKNVEVVENLSRKIRVLRTEEGRNSASALQEFEEAARVADAVFKEAEETSAFYREFGDDVAPVLQDVFNQMRDAADDGRLDDVVHIGNEAWKRKDTGKRVKDIMEILMKPFSNDLYPSSTSMGDDWLKVTFDAADDSGRLLRNMQDKVSSKSKAQRSSMASSKSSRKITMDETRATISRASMVGDNSDDVTDAFFFMTTRELRAAFDAAGGGDAGIAAQNRVAKELSEGLTARSKLWQEADNAVRSVSNQRQLLENIATRRVQRGGSYSTKALETIERLESELVKARTISDVGVSKELTALEEIVKNINQASTKETLTSFVSKASAVLASMRAAKSTMVTNETWLGLDNILSRIADEVDSGAFVNPVSKVDNLTGQVSDLKTIGVGPKVRNYLDTLNNLAETEFGDTPNVARLTQTLAKMKKKHESSIAIDGRFKEGVAILSNSVVDSGMKLSNYLILHQARVSIDAIKKLSPPGLQVSEGMWDFARAGAARQQMESVIDFQNKMNVANKIMLRVRDDVYGTSMLATPRSERASILMDAMQDLSQDEYAAVVDVVGNFRFSQQGDIAGRRPASWRRSNAQFVSIRDEILELQFPGWKQSVETNVGSSGRARARSAAPYRYEGDVRGTMGITSDVERAVLAAEESGVSIAETARDFDAPKGRNLRGLTDTENTLPDIDLLSGKDYSPIGRSVEQEEVVGWDSQAEMLARQSADANQKKTLGDTAPKTLKAYVDDFVRANRLPKEEGEALKARVDSAEKSVQVQRKNAEALIDEEVLRQDKRIVGREAKNADTQIGEAFGLAGAYFRAVKVKADGKGTANSNNIDEFFTYMFGDGSVKTGSASYKAPSRLEDPAEVAQMSLLAERFKQARLEKQVRKNEGLGDMENELQFWASIDPETPGTSVNPSTGRSSNSFMATVNTVQAERMVVAKYNYRKDIENLKKILKGVKGEQATKIDLYDTGMGLTTPSGLRGRIKDIQAKIAKIDKDLGEMERNAGRLVQIGGGMDTTFRNISASESHFGRLSGRVERRLVALQALSLDPVATKELTDLGFGVGKDSIDRNSLIGRYSYYQYLQSHLNELEAQLEVVAKAEKKVTSVDKKVKRTSQVKQQALLDARAIEDNPELMARVNQAIAGDEKLLSPKKVKFLDASRLGQKEIENPNFRSPVAEGEARPSKTIPSMYIPESVANLVNTNRNARFAIAKIESDIKYTRALQRKAEQSFFNKLSKLNYDASALEFPNAVHDEKMANALKSFAKSSNDNLKSDKPIVIRNVKERIFTEVSEKLIDTASSAKFVVVLSEVNPRTGSPSGRVASPNAVADFVRFTRGEQFKYSVSQSTTQEGRSIIVYSDGRASYTLNEAYQPGIPETVTVSEPIYMRQPQGQSGSVSATPVLAATEAGDFAQMVANRSSLIVYENKGAVPIRGAKSHFNPSSAVAFIEGEGKSVRAYGMSELGFELPRSNALNQEVVFDPNAGRGLTKEDFESLFLEPNVAPFGKRATKERSAVDKLIEQRTVLEDMLEANRAKMLSATSEKKRRYSQSMMASLSEDIQEQNSLILAAQKRMDARRPAMHMAAVQKALAVMEYFKSPEVLNQLGIPVRRESLGVDQLGAESFRSFPGTEEDAMTAFGKYVDALGSGKLPSKSIDKQIPPATVTDTVRDRRKVYLRDKFEKSEEGKLLRLHREQKNIAAASSKELAVIKAGGVAEVLKKDVSSARDALEAAKFELGISESALRRAVQKGSPKMSINISEDIATIAKADIASRRELIEGSLAKEFVASIPAEFRASVTADISANADNFAMQNFWTNAAEAEGTYTFMQARYLSAEKVLKANIASLVKEEARLNKAIDGMMQVRAPGVFGKVDSSTNAVIPAEFKELRLRLNGNAKYGVKGLKTEMIEAKKLLSDLSIKRQSIESKIITQRTAVDLGFAAKINREDATRRLTSVRNSLQDIKEFRGRKGKNWSPAGKGESTEWMAEYDDYVSELDDLLQRVRDLPDGVETDKLSAMITAYAETKSTWLRTLGLARETESQIPAMLAMGPQVYKKVLDDGFVNLTGSGSLSNFKNMQMRPEVKEIIDNMNRLIDPTMVKELNRWILPYTKFFKAWALATPGYHSRNALTNAFMMFAAGGKPRFLYEGMIEYNKLQKALKQNIPFEQYAATLPVERRQIVTDSYDAMLGSGVGQSAEIAFDTAGPLTNNFWTRGNRRVGIWTESHSRFMLAYDGMRQGFDVNGATARTRRFLFDYEDLSTLDVTMRAIMPFWMWTSRILPLTIQNIYMNPKPYQFYNNLRRNLEDREKTSGLPQYMRDAGAFGLPGTDFAATPDLGFTRVTADIKQLTNPTKFASNINPALRIPAEFLAGKTFFRDREFDKTPKQVDGPVGNLASLLGTPIGMGGRKGGKNFVDERLLYGVTNALPMLNQVERFVPSQEYYQQRGSKNPLLGVLGAPVRQVTPDMKNSEQRRILAELKKLMDAQMKVNPNG